MVGRRAAKARSSVLAIACLLAGCIAAPGPDPSASTAPRFAWQGQDLDATQALLWDGPSLTALPSETTDEPPCEASNCVRYPFDVTVPDAYWETHTGGLAVSMKWGTGPGEAWRWFNLKILDASGRVLTVAPMAELGLLAFLPEAPSGSYQAEILMMPWSGTGGFQASILVDAAPADLPVRQLLPDVVTLTPSDLRIEYPGDVIACVDGDPAGAGWLCQGTPPETAAVLAAGGAKGCNLDETAEHGGRRCLRFNNFFGNAGDGPLELWLSPEEGVKAYTGQGTFAQRIHASDGTVREVPAGPAAFHPFHRHFHALGIVEFNVHAFDLATGLRGDEVASERKTGMCLFHSGLVELGKPGTRPAVYVSTCFATGPATVISARLPSTAPILEPLLETGWNMTLNPNWFDVYYWGMDENYVDIAGVPDGTYELVSTANVDGFILESDPDNNSGSVVFRLSGDDVEVIPRPAA